MVPPRAVPLACARLASLCARENHNGKSEMRRQALEYLKLAYECITTLAKPGNRAAIDAASAHLVFPCPAAWRDGVGEQSLEHGRRQALAALGTLAPAAPGATVAELKQQLEDLGVSKVRGLESEAGRALNGEAVTLICLKNDRWTVEFRDGAQRALKPENLAPCGGPPDRCGEQQELEALVGAATTRARDAVIAGVLAYFTAHGLPARAKDPCRKTRVDAVRAVGRLAPRGHGPAIAALRALQGEGGDVGAAAARALKGLVLPKPR